MNEPKPYQVFIKIIQIWGIEGKDEGGTSDPFVKVICADQPPQKTKTLEGTRAGQWNQSFSFDNVLLTDYQLQTSDLRLEVFDFNRFRRDEMIGFTSIGLSTLYRSLNHEMDKQWLPIFREDAQDQNLGAIMVSCFIIGQGDKAPARQAEEGGMFEVGEGSEIDYDALSPAQKAELENQKDRFVEMIQQPKIYNKGYQLIVSIGLADQLKKVYNCFVSVRVAGLFQITSSTDSQSPTFGLKFAFPLYFPFINDKIIINVWAKGGLFSDNKLIGRVPEVSSAKDIFNISKLQTNEGRMPPTWINMYGDVNGLALPKKFLLGHDFAGRLLVSMALIPADDPRFYAAPADSMRSPQEIEYYLWIEVYRVRRLKSNPNFIVSIGILGGTRVTSERAKKDFKGEPNFEWDQETAEMEEKRLNLPKKPKMIPDIILQVAPSNQIKKVAGFVRIPAHTVYEKRESKPEWYPLRHPSDPLGQNVGQVLANVQLVKCEGAPARNPRLPTRETKFQFMLLLYQGYMLGNPGETNPEKDEHLFHLEIGDTVVKSKQTFKGRNPVMKDLRIVSVRLLEDLKFCPNLVVQLRKKKGLLSDEKIIGEFQVPLTSLKIGRTYEQDNLLPQYFTLVHPRSRKFRGKVLAKFLLFNQFKGETQKLKANMLELLQGKDQFDLSLGVLGVRNLPQEVSKPKLEVNVCGANQAIQMQPPQYMIGRKTANPSFFQIAKLDDIKLPRCLVLWPLVEIKLRYSKLIGEEVLSSTFPLVYYNNDGRDELREGTMAQIFVAPGEKFPLKQEQINEKILKKADDQMSTIRSETEESSDSDIENDDFLMGDGERANNLVAQRGGGGGPNENPFDASDDDSERENEMEEMDLLKKQKKGKNKKEEEVQGSKEEDQTEQEQDSKLAVPKKRALAPGQAIDDEPDDGVKEIFIDFDSCDCMQCLQEDKDKIKERNKQIVMGFEEEKKAIKKDKIMPKDDKIENINRLNKQIKFYEDENIDPQLFIGRAGDDIGLNFNMYEGREVLDGGETYENSYPTPYERIPIFKTSEFNEMSLRNPLEVESINFTVVKMRVLLEDPATQHMEGFLDPEQIEEEQKIVVEEKDEIPDELVGQYFFDICKQKCMDRLLEIDSMFYRIALNIVSCKNLAAQEDAVDFKYRLAGYKARSAADPYPEVYVGSGNSLSGCTRKVIDTMVAQKKTLNPDFFRMYDLGMILPDDWRMEIKIRDNGILASDIGSMHVDLEDRLMSRSNFLLMESLQIALREYKYHKKKCQADNDDRGRKLMENKMANIETLKTFFTAAPAQNLPPVEYKDLFNKKKPTSQGKVEYSLMILTERESGSFKLPPIPRPPVDEYELRIVIWEAQEVPLVDDGHVDITIKVTMNQSGWEKGEIVKQTDVHFGSEDGRGIFNWRMLFPLRMPVRFPALKLAIFDAEHIGDDTVVGEVMVHFGRMLAAIKQEGHAQESIWVYLTDPMGGMAGKVKLTMELLNQTQADARKVGEAQNEPNRDPYLEKPTEGRGALAILKSFGLPKITLPKFNLFRNLIICAVILMIFGVLFLIVMLV